MKNLLLLLLATLLGACSYSFNMNSYPNLTTLEIAEFGNKTDEFILDQEIVDALNQKFNSDNRLRLVSRDPDVIIQGTLLDYEDTALEYDLSENVSKRRVRVLLSVNFTDTTQEKVLWENKSLAISKDWVIDGDNPAGLPTTEEDARQDIWQDLFDTIIKNTLESW